MWLHNQGDWVQFWLSGSNTVLDRSFSLALIETQLQFKQKGYLLAFATGKSKDFALASATAGFRGFTFFPFLCFAFLNIGFIYQQAMFVLWQRRPLAP